MKTKLYIALGVGAAVAGFAAWYLLSKRSSQSALPVHENERKHLTNVFSKAKAGAM